MGRGQRINKVESIDHAMLGDPIRMSKLAERVLVYFGLRAPLQERGQKEDSNGFCDELLYS